MLSSSTVSSQALDSLLVKGRTRSIVQVKKVMSSAVVLVHGVRLSNPSRQCCQTLS